MDQATIKEEEKAYPASEPALAAAVSATAPTAEPAKESLPAEPSKEKPFVSKGWKVHNEITYRGVDWLLNSSIGVAFSYWQDRTKSGAKYFGEPVGKAFRFILSPFMKGAALKEGAKWGTNFAGIMAGGFTIIPIMMAMENKKNKKKIVHWLDEKMYGKDVVASDPKFEESYKKIDEEPPKGFWIGMVSRFIAIAPIITAVSIPAVNTYLDRFIYKPISGITKGLAKHLRIKPNENMANPLKGALEHIDCDARKPKEWMSNWEKLHKLIGFDFGLTIFYAILHEMAYKSMAALGMKTSKEDKKQKAAPAETPRPLPEPAPAATEEKGKFATAVGPRKALAEPASLHTDKVVSQPDSQPQVAI